jgi:transposase
MSKTKIKHTHEFKKEAVKLVTEQAYSQAEAARRLGVSAKNLSRWVKEAEETNSKMAKVKKNAKVEQEELLQLRKEVKRLRMEREILKKAAAFFANELN